jgi:hypothetical protein
MEGESGDKAYGKQSVKAFIIKVNHGGLGDHLFYSHLPRIAKSISGFEKVFISTNSEYRNETYRHLVWELNPYVDGFTDDDAPVSACSSVPDGMNLLDGIMLERGLDDGVRFHEPEVYYKPNLLGHLKDCSVYDPNFMSNAGRIDPQGIERFFRFNLGLDYQLQPKERSVTVSCHRELLTTKSLFDYCDVIYSCRRFCCLTSGGATLAPALGKQAVVFVATGVGAVFQHSKRNTYVDCSMGVLATNEKPEPGTISLFADKLVRKILGRR